MIIGNEKTKYPNTVPKYFSMFYFSRNKVITPKNQTGRYRTEGERKMSQTKQVTFKIGPMRKSVEWTVYPESQKRPDEGHMAHRMLFVQSDKRALNIDLKTKKGMLSNGKGHSDFASTTSFLGAIEIDVPDEIIQLCLNFQPKNGDRIAHGVYIA